MGTDDTLDEYIRKLGLLIPGHHKCRKEKFNFNFSEGLIITLTVAIKLEIELNGPIIIRVM